MKRIFIILACTAFLVACGGNKAQKNDCEKCKTECNAEKKECNKQECADKKCEQQCAEKQCADKKCEQQCEKQCADKKCEQQCEKQCADNKCEQQCAEKQCEKPAAGCIKINSEEFAKLVADLSQPEWKYLGDKPAVVDFYADWCGPCKAIAPALEEIAKEYDGELYIYKINVDDDGDIADAFNISAIPTLLFIPMEGRYAVKRGAMSKEELVNVIKESCFK